MTTKKKSSSSSKTTLERLYPFCDNDRVLMFDSGKNLMGFGIVEYANKDWFALKSDVPFMDYNKSWPQPTDNSLISHLTYNKDSESSKKISKDLADYMSPVVQRIDENNKKHVRLLKTYERLTRILNQIYHLDVAQAYMCRDSSEEIDYDMILMIETLLKRIMKKQ